MRQALELALEALTAIDGAMPFPVGKSAITAIKEALAQPEQEPVAVVDVHEFYDNCANFSLLQKLPKGKHTLYTAPPQPKEPEQEQEPVACVQDLDEVKRKHLVYEKGMDWKDPLYTTPPHRKPLSDEQLKEIWLKGKDHGDDWLDVQGIARAIEAAHGIKE